MLPCGVCCDASVFILQIYEANGEVVIWLVETFYSRVFSISGMVGSGGDGGECLTWSGREKGMGEKRGTILSL